MSCSAEKNTLVVSVLIIFITGFDLILAQWQGIDPCLDSIDCFQNGTKFNLSVANPENCAQYFLCRNTTLYLTQCPSGYQYDILFLRCANKNLHCSKPCSPSQMSYKDHIFKDSTGTSTTRSDDNDSDHRTSPTTFFSTFVPQNLTTTLSKYDDNLSPASFPMKSTFSVATVTTYTTTMSSSSASLTKRDDVVSSSLKPLGSTVSIRESEKTFGYSNSTSVSNRKTDSDQTQKPVTLTSAKNITPSMSPSTLSTSMSPSTLSMSPSTPSMSPSTPSMSPSSPSMSPSTPSMSPSTSSMSPSTPSTSMSPSTPSMSPSTPSMSPSTPSMSPSTPSTSMSPSTPSMSPSTPSMSPSTLSMSPSILSMSPSTSSMSPSTQSMSPSTPSTNMSPSTPSMSPSTPSMSPSTPSMSPSTPSTSMSPSTPSMSPSTPSMSPSTPSMSPSTPSTSMSPSTPSMSPSTPSMLPSTPSMSPSTSSMSPSTPSMSSSMSSTIAPIMPTNSTQEFSTSSQSSSTIAPIMPTNSTQEFSTSSQTSSTIAPIMPTNSTQEFSTSSQKSSTIAPIIPTNSTQEFSTSSQTSSTIAPIITTNSTQEFSTSIPTSSTIAPIMPTNSTQEFSPSSQTSSTIAPIVPTISTSVDPSSGRTSSLNFTSLESTNTPNNITEDIFSSTTLDVSTHSIIEISSSEITTQVPNIPTNSTISSFRLTTSTIMPSVPTISTSEFSSSDIATSTTLTTNMPGNGTFEISTEPTSDMPNNITGELSSPQLITSPSVTLKFPTNATVELSSPGMTSSAATPIIFPRNMTEELSSEGTKSSDATASASTDSTIISSSWKPTQAATSLDMQGSTAHSTPQKTTPITLSQSTSSSPILGNFSSDAFSFKTNSEQSSSTKDKSTPAQAISSVIPTSVSAVSRILSIGSTSMGSIVSTSIFSAQNPVTDLTQSPGVGTTFGVINSCRSPTSCIINDLMGDPDDCFRYYECIAVPSSDNRWINKVCPGNQQFDIRSKTCSSSAPIECQPRCPTNTSHSVWMNPKQAIEGGLLQFVCSFWVQSSFNQIQVEKFEWQLNGIQLTPSGNRISVSQTAADANGTITSTLTFFPASITDSGVIRSVVKYGSKFTSTLVTTPFVVLPLPSVQILPLSITIYPNTNISISCQADVGKSNFLTGSVDANVSVVTFDWFRNGVLITADDFESKITTKGMSSILKASPAASVVYSCRARNSVGVGGNESLTVTVIPEYLPSCKAEQKDGLFWTMTSINDTAVLPCKKPLIGFVERQCSKQSTTGAAIWLEPNTIHCIDETLSDIHVQIDRINEGFGANNISIILGVITALEDFSSSGPLGLGDLNTTIVLVGEIASICSSLPDTILLTSDEVEPAIQTINNLLSSINRPTWMDMKMSDPSAAARLMKAVDIFASLWARSLKPGQQNTLITDNIVVEVACDYAHSVGSISYPQQTSTMEDSFWMMSSEDKIEVSNATLQPDHGTDSVLYISSSYYNNIHDFLPVNTSQHLNSRVLSLSIDGIPSTDSLAPGVRILLQNISGNWSDANFTRSCAFWDFTYNGWSSNGCKVISEDPTSTSCECNHLTNFAILMSPTVASKEDELILSIISIIGCIISLVSLVLTLIMYAMRWKIIKSHHAVVIINLCIALIIANVVFLAGVDKVNPPEVCTTVAVLLHYFFLAAFFIMLAEGVELLLYIVFVFHVRRKRETALLILTAWVIPLIIVGVSLAITQTRGYGGSRSCWLSIENGLLWAFVGPALTVIGINLLIMLIVLIRIARANRPIEKSGFKPRMKATVWNIMVITPVLGVTWVFGVLAVSQSLIAFQYVFAVANSLQGFFIFVFHGLCNRRRQKKSRYSVKLPSNRSRSSQGGRIRAKSSQRQNRLTTSDIVVMMSPPDSSDSQTILPDYDRRSDAITRIRDGEKVSVCSSSSSSSSSGVSQADSDYHSNNTITTDVLSNNSHNSNHSNVAQRKVDSAAHTTFF